MHFRGQSDAIITKGLVAVLIALYSGRPAAEIAETDAVEWFRKVGLSDHLGMQRSNGLVAMVNRIRSEARAAA
jgi:cysteine desulfuration protein SufE